MTTVNKTQGSWTNLTKSTLILVVVALAIFWIESIATEILKSTILWWIEKWLLAKVEVSLLSSAKRCRRIVWPFGEVNWNVEFGQIKFLTIKVEHKFLSRNINHTANSVALFDIGRLNGLTTTWRIAVKDCPLKNVDTNRKFVIPNPISLSGKEALLGGPAKLRIIVCDDSGHFVEVHSTCGGNSGVYSDKRQPRLNISLRVDLWTEPECHSCPPR